MGHGAGGMIRRFTGRVDFATLAPGRRSNVFLLLPDGFASTAAPDARSPVFDCDPERLAAAARAAILAQPPVTLVRDIDAELQFTVMQRSRLLRFPDHVTLQALPAAGGRSALAVYSRSKYGRKDFGVNRARVEAWVKAIGEAVSPGGGM